MKRETKQKVYWRKLDDQAKIFSLSNNKKDPSIFRLSVTMKEKVESKFLKQALELALEKYRAFKVQMERGLFWHYLKENEKSPVIKEEQVESFKKLNTKENNNYLFKLTYFKKKINIDFFHTLTDGNGGREFFKEIIYKYLELRYPKKLKLQKPIKQKILIDSENSYKKNYLKKLKKWSTEKKGYMIRGKNLEKGKININHFVLKLEEIKRQAKEKNCTLSVYLISMIAYSVYETNYKKNKDKKPLNICVPINLKKYFPSETLSNFVSHMVVSLKFKHKNRQSFDEILAMVKKEFKKKLNYEKIAQTITANGKTLNNFFINFTPLAIKRQLVILGSFFVKRQFSMTFSNIGKIEMDNKYSKYIETQSFTLAPDWAEKVKCGVCSYNDKLVITFGTNIQENYIENKFKDLLTEKRIKFRVESNDVNLIS